MPYETLSVHNQRRQAYWDKLQEPILFADAICDDCGERLAFDKVFTLATLPPPPMPLPVTCPQCGKKGHMLR